MVAVDVANYDHSPVHKAIILKDYIGLKKIISELPQFCDLSKIQTEPDSLTEDAKADARAAVLDQHDVPNRDTPLHLAIKFGDHIAVEILLLAGADYGLQNDEGWNALQEAVCNGEKHIKRIMLRHYEPLAWAKWYRWLPRLIGTMRRMRDFYMEIKFHFESSAVPFISRIAPSDTYKIWKRGANFRADLTLAGFEGFRVQRSSKSFRFLSDGSEDGKLSPGMLCIVSHKDKQIMYGFEGSANPATEAELRREIRRTTCVTRARMNVNQAVLLPQTTWRGREKTEMVGRWKAKVYDMHNVVVSHTLKKVSGATRMDNDSGNELYDVLTEEERKQLDDVLKMDSNDDDVIDQSETERGKKGWLSGWRRKLNKQSEKKTDLQRLSLSEELKDLRSKSPPSTSYKSADHDPTDVDVKRDKDPSERDAIQEKEHKKSLRPTLWLSSDFPLRIEEFLPLLDILANRVTAIQRLREYLTTKFPQGTFPVKVSVPVVPTIRLIVMFTKFEELKPSYEDLSSPATAVTRSSNSSSSTDRPDCIEDLLAFPSGYTWVTPEKKRKYKIQRLHVSEVVT